MEPTAPYKIAEPGIYQGVPESVAQKKNDAVSAPRIMRTMKNDAAEAIKKQNETSVSIAIAEEKKRTQARAEAVLAKQIEDEMMHPAPKRVGRAVVVLGLALVVISAVLAYLYLLPKLKNAAVLVPSARSLNKPASVTLAPAEQPAEPLAPSLIPAQYEKRFNTAKESPAQAFAAIATEREKGTPATSIKNFYFAEEGSSGSVAISADRFLGFANIQAPEILVRSLEKPFMAGFIGESNGGATPFLVFKVSGYDTSLAGMLEGEQGLPHLFDVVFGTHYKTTSAPVVKFHDAVIAGKDARVLELPQSVVIAYAFASQSTIVIAESTTALEALLPLVSVK